MEYDIRTTIKLPQGKNVTTEQVRAALKQLATELGRHYEEQVVHEIDDIKTVHVGLSGKHPAEDIIVRTGSLLSETTLVDKAPYAFIGIGSWEWPRTGYSVGDFEQESRTNVQKVKESLERILTKN